MMGAATQRESGFALIVVLIVVALATSATVAMSVTMNHKIERLRDGDLFTQARLHLRALEFWAGGLLQEDAGLAAIDTRQDIWTNELYNVELDNGLINARISDLQGRLNLNNLALEGEAGELARQRFERLLQILGLDTTLVAAVADWVDEDQQQRAAGGAEDEVYLARSPAYRAANRPMAEVSELLLVNGVSQADYAVLEAYVCALPVGTAININTAPAEVLMSLADGISQALAEQLVLRLNQTPFSVIAADSDDSAALAPGSSDPAQQDTGSNPGADDNNWTWSALQDRDTGITADDVGKDDDASEFESAANPSADPAAGSFAEALSLQGVILNPLGLEPSSRYFLVQGAIQMGEEHLLESRAVMFRNQAGQVRTLWRRYGD